MPSVPFAFLTTSLTVYTPGRLYTVDGFCSVESWPFPKSQFQNLGSPVDKSENVTLNGTHPDRAFTVKFATGAWANANEDNAK